MTHKLYPLFNHWYRGGQVYFYSDPHFADEEMRFLRADYVGDEEQIERINQKIGRKDTLVILGDIGEKEWLKKIRGYKILVLGNHDTGVTTYEDYADEVYSGPLMISPKILLTHEPVEFPFALNLHGHDHSQRTFQDQLHWNLCAENINYTPISLKEIIKSGKIGRSADIHEQAR